MLVMMDEINLYGQPSGVWPDIKGGDGIESK